MPSLKERSLQTHAFTALKSFRRLQELALHAIDLNAPGILTPERLHRFIASSAGWKMLYGTERVTDEVMEALYQLATEAIVWEKMDRMQAGDVVNFIEGYPSEERPALHTAARDFFENPQTAPKAKEAAQLLRQEVEKIKQFSEKIEREGRFKEMIFIAIGGSDLGPRAHYIALEGYRKPDFKIHFIANVDPDDVALALEGVSLDNCLVAVVSKSGTTLETATNEALVRAHFQRAGLKPEEHFISITGKGSPMDDRSRYLESFYIWDWVGGRFSTTAAVGGLLIACSCGFSNYWEFLRGAHAMDMAARERDLSANLPLLGALLAIWNRNFLNYPTTAMIPYSQGLLRYSAHIQQVEMESNGKRIDKRGNAVTFQTVPVIWGEPGTNAQHSFFQMIHQGTATIPVEFIGFKESQYNQDLLVEGTTSQEKLISNLLAQMLALAIGQKKDNPNVVFPGNRPSHLLLTRKLTPFSLGALLAYYEHKVVFQGFIWDINSFDQEGVQLGKVLAKELIHIFAERRKGETIIEPYPLGDALLSELDQV